MSDNDEKKPLGIRGGGPKAGNVKQSFSHGRTKSVVVETKRKRIIVPKSTSQITSKSPVSKSAPSPSKRPSGITDAEMERRLNALKVAKEHEKEEAARREQKEKDHAKERAARLAENTEKEKAEKEREEKARKKTEEDAKKLKELEIASLNSTPPPVGKPTDSTSNSSHRSNNKSSGSPSKKPEEEGEKNKGKGKTLRDGDGRRSGRLTLNQVLAGADGGRQRSMAAMKRKQERARQKMLGKTVEREKIVRDVQLPEAITVQELSNRMAERVSDVVKSLMNNGIMATQNETLDADTAELIIEEFGHKVVRVSDSDVEDVIDQIIDDEKDLVKRPPVITVMGHVDHGKTSLLDAIRNSKVTSGEAGGITQHIGAYQVIQDGSPLTFLDTPGHAAFTSMRARGAQVTDIVILVVAADDAVMPQTIEAINHSKAAKVPVIVAINKVDKEEANPDKVRTGLLQHEIIVEKMSGDVLDVEVSAISGQGLDSLLESISLQSELLDLKANPNRAASGAVIEASLDVGRGAVATVLIKNGTLKQGDIFVVGEQYGKVRALINDKGERINNAGPSTPVEVLGLNGTPEAGDVLNVVDTEAQAREISSYRNSAAKDRRAAAGASTTLEQLMAKAKDDKEVSELPIVVKGDVQGSVEAIVQAMEKIGNSEVRVRVLHSGVGAITESDIGLAEASGAPVIGFNVRANSTARSTANQKGLEIRYYSIIYDLVDDIKKAASGLLSAEIKETFIGYAKIKEVFKVTGVGRVAGCIITEGIARRSAGVRLLRDNVVIHEGTLKTLKRFKDEVSEVQSGQECGMAFEAYEDIRPEDIIEIFERQEIERSLS
ncbi:MAG: translation initiation factor IF-2 [Paracoccaceae bacterium]